MGFGEGRQPAARGRASRRAEELQGDDSQRNQPEHAAGQDGQPDRKAGQDEHPRLLETSQETVKSKSEKERERDIGHRVRRGLDEDGRAGEKLHGHVGKPGPLARTFRR